MVAFRSAFRRKRFRKIILSRFCAKRCFKKQRRKKKRGDYRNKALLLLHSIKKNRRKMMKRIYLITMLFCLSAIGAQAQTPPPTNTNGPVWRVTYFKVKPGKGPEYIKFLRENTTLIFDEQKKQGLILDYKYFSQPAQIVRMIGTWLKWSFTGTMPTRSTLIRRESRKSTQLVSNITGRRKPERRQTTDCATCAMCCRAILCGNKF